MEELFNEFLSNIQLSEEDIEECYILDPTNRTKLYFTMLSYASNCIPESKNVATANCIVKLFSKFIDKLDNNCSYEYIMHLWYDQDALYIRNFYMEYDENGVLTRSLEQFHVGIYREQLECINNMIKKLDECNCYDRLSNCREGLSLMSEAIVYS